MFQQKVILSFFNIPSLPSYFSWRSLRLCEASPGMAVQFSLCMCRVSRLRYSILYEKHP